MRVRSNCSMFVLSLVTAAVATAQDPAVVGAANYKVTLDNERVRILEVTFKQGESAPMHAHPDHLAYVVSGGKLELTYADGRSQVIDAKAGETLFVPAEAHSSKNVGKSTLRAVVTELKEAAPAASLSGGERAEILELYDRSGGELQALVARTPDELWAKKPAPDRWSVSEVVEHLALVEKALNGFILQTLAAPADPNWAVTESSRSIDAILRAGTDRAKKFQSPEFAVPKGGMSRADLLASWGGARAQNAELVRRTTAAVKKHTADVPNGGKMTMHQLMAYVAIHNLRHNAQIAEALAQLQK